MGYACPVCDVPQRDAEHLANHLAFTALLRHEDHEEWLDEHLPDWNEAGPAELAPRVAERAESADYDEVFEDTTDGGDTSRPGDRGHDHDHDRVPGGAAAVDRGADPSGEAAAVVEEARAYTREMYGLDEGSEATDDGEDGADGADERGDADADAAGDDA